MADQTQPVELPSLAPVPADDGAIQAAFDLVDAQMKAWLSAMERAQQGLSAGISPVVAQPVLQSQTFTPPLETETQSSNAEPARENQSQESNIPLEDERAGIAQATQSVTEPPVAVDDDADEPSAPAEQPVEQVEMSEAAESAPALTEPEPLEAASEPEGDGSPDADEKQQAEEDEALLATLDPETAQAIRVMRRLSVEKKSVSQLLAEYEAAKASQPAPASRKKSWFRR